MPQRPKPSRNPNSNPSHIDIHSPTGFRWTPHGVPWDLTGSHKAFPRYFLASSREIPRHLRRDAEASHAIPPYYMLGISCGKPRVSAWEGARLWPPVAFGGVPRHPMGLPTDTWLKKAIPITPCKYADPSVSLYSLCLTAVHSHTCS